MPQAHTNFQCWALGGAALVATVNEDIVTGDLLRTLARFACVILYIVLANSVVVYYYESEQFFGYSATLAMNQSEASI